MKRTTLVLAATLLLTACADAAVDATNNGLPVPEDPAGFESGGDIVDPTSRAPDDGTGRSVPTPSSVPPICNLHLF